ncbi:MAG: PD-(D/E)XK nuclease family protein [Candidatus Acidiferrum sp.]
MIPTTAYGPSTLVDPNCIGPDILYLYGGEVRVKFSPEDHKYLVSDVAIDDGAWLQVPSVTTVIGKMLAKPQLVSWATKLSMQEFLKRVEEGRAYSRAELDSIAPYVKDAHKMALDAAGKTGSAVHSWLEKFILARDAGRGFPPPPTDLQVRSCCSAGRKWVIDNDVRPIAVESILFSRKHRVIGTMDLAATLSVNGCITVADFKSSNRLHRSYGLQLSAYKAMLLEQQNIAAEGRILVRLDKTAGTFHPEKLSQETAAQEEAAFFKLVDAYSTLNGFQFFEE